MVGGGRGGVSLAEFKKNSDRRQPQFLTKWNTTSILHQNGRQPYFFLHIGNKPQYFDKMEDNFKVSYKMKD